MFDLLNEFFEDDFALGFGKPVLIRYNTPYTKDMNPAFWQKQKNDDDNFDLYRATIRSVGVSKDDVRIEVNNNSIDVNGKTTTNGIDYDFACSLPVADSIIENIDKITYETINGITYVYLYVKRNKANKIKIEKI